MKEYLKDATVIGEIIRDIDLEKKKFPPLSYDELLEILGLTIKRDEVNKLITFNCMISAYTKSSQFNISFNSPSATGKSYIPGEIASLFPQKDVISLGHCSPTSFFHDVEGTYDKDRKVLFVNLSRVILIFLDQPHTQLLQNLRPLLSHDKEEINLKITDRTKNIGMRTKNIIIKGFPAVIFCSAGLRLDEQEATRFFLLSPEITQEKIREAINEKIRKESDPRSYIATLEANPKRQALKERIRAIKEANIEAIKIRDTSKIEKVFFEKKKLKPRHTRDSSRLISLIMANTLLNFWHREIEGDTVIANEEDIAQGLKIWNSISRSQELNLPEYVYSFYIDIIQPLLENALYGITRQAIIKKNFETYERPLADWQLRKEILPLLEMAGLIVQDSDPKDKRRTLIFSADKYGQVYESDVSLDNIK